MYTVFKLRAGFHYGRCQYDDCDSEDPSCAQSGQPITGEKELEMQEL